MAKILIVEDDCDTAAVMKEWFGVHWHSADVASQCSRALSWLATNERKKKLRSISTVAVYGDRVWKEETRMREKVMQEEKSRENLPDRSQKYVARRESTVNNS